MRNFQEQVNFLWSVADEVLRDDISRGKYKDVILPFTVLRRLDCVLEATKERVLSRHAELKRTGLQNMDGQLRHASGYAFYNTSQYDFQKLLADPKNIDRNLISYINNFSDNMDVVLDKFKLRNTIGTLQEKGLTFLLVQKFANVDLHPDAVSNHEMGTIFEELIRRFNEQLNENPGEHFTPREVIELMVRLAFLGDDEKLAAPGKIATVYDPACGTGGMLSIAKEYAREISPTLDIHLFGQEINDETFAVCKSDMYIKGDDKDAENIKPDSSFSKDGHPTTRFDYMLSNPPYGKDWKKEKTAIEKEAGSGHLGRFGAGLPRVGAGLPCVSDGQLLFLQHMLSKMHPVEAGGSRIAIIMNGSPLFTGDAGSGETEIRRWIIENDWLEAIVALPTELFYNTGISTYIWVLTNRKGSARRGKILLVNGAATTKTNGSETDIFARKMRRSLGNKRKELAPEHVDALARLVAEFDDGPHAKIFDAAGFGYRRITVERPLRLNFQASPERIARLPEQSAFGALATSRKKGAAGEADSAAGRQQQTAILAALATLDPATLDKDRNDFERRLDAALKAHSLKPAAPVRKAILAALSEPDETAAICRDSKGRPEPDGSLRDNEYVPLTEDIRSYFKREVLPHVPDAWIDESVTDPKDGGIGKVGYEINLNRYFYEYTPPRPLAEIDADLERLEREILDMLREVVA